MKTMKAVVKNKETKQIEIIESEYNNKSDFRKDLNRNGYQVVGRISIQGELNLRNRMYDLGVKI